MSGIVVLNAALAIFALAVIIGLCTWGIVADLRQRRGGPLARRAVAPVTQREPERHHSPGKPNRERRGWPKVMDSAA